MWSAITRKDLVVQIGAARLTRSRFDQRVKNVDFVVAVHMLQDGGQTLQAHAGVHAGRGQFVQAAIGLHVELHEHVVPDFDEAVAVFAGAAGWAAGDVVAVVVEDFGARAARAGVGHHPEVVALVFLAALVVANAHHALGGKPISLCPDIKSLVVVDVDRGQQASRRAGCTPWSAAPSPTSANRA